MTQTTTAVVAAADGGRQPQQGIGKSIQGIIRTHLHISNRFSKAKLLETMKKLLQKIFIIHLSCIPIQDKSKVITDEIGWLDFYAEYNCKFYQDKRRSKKRTIQAKQEIILNAVFTICYDVFSGLVHYFSTNPRPLDSNLLTFLQRSQSLLSICMDDYWAAYDRSGEPVKKTEGDATKSTTCMEGVSKRGPGCSKSKSIHASPPNKITSKLISASTAMWMGTWLLCVDVLVSMKLVMRGRRLQEL